MTCIACHFIDRNELPVAFSSFLHGEEVNGATPPCFLISCMSISAYKASTIANLFLEVGITKEATFLTAIKLLIIARLSFACSNGERTTSPSCASIDPYNALFKNAFVPNVCDVFS